MRRKMPCMKASDAIDTSPVIASEIVPLSLEPEIAAAVSSSSSSPLTDLPTDVLLLIRSHIHTLAGLVHFSQTCTTLRRLYNEDLWRGACIAAGFGLPTEYDLTWGGVAAAVVADAAGMNWRGADDDDDDDDEYEAMYRSWPASDYTQADKVYEPLRESNIQPAVLEQQDTPLQLDEVGTIGWDLLRGKDLKDTISYGMIDVQPVLRHPSLAFRLATQPHVDSLDARFSHHTLDTHEDFCVENQNGVCIYDLMLPYAELFIIVWPDRNRMQDWVFVGVVLERELYNPWKWKRDTSNTQLGSKFLAALHRLRKSYGRVVLRFHPVVFILEP